MAYRAPAFLVEHKGAALALSAIYARNASALTDASKRAFTDQRQTPLGSFTATAFNAGVEFDHGSGAGSSVINRCVIPAGHTLNLATTVEVVSGTTAGIGTPSLLGTAASLVPSVPADIVLTPVSGRRYFALQLPSNNSGTYSMGEIWIGTRYELTADAWVQPSWGLGWQPEVTDDRFGGRLASVELAPPVRRFGLEVLNVDPSGFDWFILDLVLQAGRVSPFWYWPPDDNSTSSGPFLVKLAAPGTCRQESRAPLSTGPRYAFSLDMLEQLT